MNPTSSINRRNAAYPPPTISNRRVDFSTDLLSFRKRNESGRKKIESVVNVFAGTGRAEKMENGDPMDGIRRIEEEESGSLVWAAMDNAEAANDSLASRKSQHAESSLRKSRRVSESVKQEAAADDGGEIARIPPTCTSVPRRRYTVRGRKRARAPYRVREQKRRVSGWWWWWWW